MVIDRSIDSLILQMTGNKQTFLIVSWEYVFIGQSIGSRFAVFSYEMRHVEQNVMWKKSTRYFQWICVRKRYFFDFISTNSPLFL